MSFLAHHLKDIFEVVGGGALGYIYGAVVKAKVEADYAELKAKFDAIKKAA
jgi:hypothetical protein